MASQQDHDVGVTFGLNVFVAALHGAVAIECLLLLLPLTTDTTQGAGGNHFSRNHVVSINLILSRLCKLAQRHLERMCRTPKFLCIDESTEVEFALAQKL